MRRCSMSPKRSPRSMPFWTRSRTRRSGPFMIRNFHAHIYFDPEQAEQAKALGHAARDKFSVAEGHYHLRPVGPHPRGSCQLTVPVEQFGEVAQWLVLNRGEL